MTVHTHPTATQASGTVEVTPTTGPVARIVAGSLAAGAAAALVLTLVVFPGGTEGRITGSLLVGFGFGWALLAALTGRYTNRPQRWAAVPAALMAATGLALLAFTPDNDTMTWLNWVWPPVMLALAVWMSVQIRRTLPGRGRWLLTPVIGVLALASVGATYENITLVRDQNTYAAPGTLYDVGDHRLHLDCHGHGGPTVVLFNGMGEISAHWARIAGPVAETTRVCAYDRAGQGWSEDADHPQDGIEAAEDLHTLLTAAGETGPYVLAGHSTGGTYALNYAARYSEQVAGMVLLDSSSPEQLTKIPAYAGQYAVMRRGFALLPTLNRLGLGRAFPAAQPARTGSRPGPGTHLDRTSRQERPRRAVGRPRRLRPSPGTHHPRRPTARGPHRLRESERRRLGRRPGPARRPLHQQRPPQHRVDPRGGARRRRPGGRVGSRHRRGHRRGPHRLAPGPELTTPGPTTPGSQRARARSYQRSSLRAPVRLKPAGPAQPHRAGWSCPAWSRRSCGAPSLRSSRRCRPRPPRRE